MKITIKTPTRTHRAMNDIDEVWKGLPMATLDTPSLPDKMRSVRINGQWYYPATPLFNEITDHDFNLPPEEMPIY